MEELINVYKVYIRTDDSNRVTAVNSSAFLFDPTGWTEIDEGAGDNYHHAQGNYLPLGLTDGNGSYNYNYENGTLIERTAEEKSTELLPALISAKITESKVKLAEWLAENPILFTDGKYYSVTEEKQSLLNSNLASYERATNAGIDYPLKWNSTGEECVCWSYPDLLTLSLSIAGHIAPKVAQQQALELQLKACATLAELEAIVIDYSS